MSTRGWLWVAAAAVAAVLVVPRLDDVAGAVRSGDELGPAPSEASVDLDAFRSGRRAGEVRVGPGPGAACQPRDADDDQDRRCVMSFVGTVGASTGPVGAGTTYEGSYEGSALVEYDAAARARVLSGSVTYSLERPGLARWRGELTVAVDPACSTVVGWPGADHQRYVLVERDQARGYSTRSSGHGINELESDLDAGDVFVSRWSYAPRPGCRG